MGLELEASASIGVAIGDKLDSLHNLLAKEDPRPSYIFPSRAATGTAVVLDFGRPPVGKIWNILAVVTFAGDDHTAVTGGNLAWYGAGDTVDPPGLMGLRDTNIAIPTGKTYTKEVMWVYPTENLIASMIATGSTQLGANFVIAEWNIKDKW